MKLPKIKHSFTAYPDAIFSLFGDDIVRGLTDNSFFPSIAPALTIFDNALKAFQLSIPTPSDRSPARNVAKRVTKAEVITQLVLLSYLVSYEAKMSLEALETTNFELQDKPQAKGLVGTVKSLVLQTNGVRGMVIIKCEKDDNATLYNARVSTDNENWTWFKSNTSRTVKITNLPIGDRIYVQMQLENDKGTSPWSQSKMGMILEAEAIQSIHS
jgi:hypothetical protein